MATEEHLAATTTTCLVVVAAVAVAVVVVAIKTSKWTIATHGAVIRTAPRVATAITTASAFRVVEIRTNQVALVKVWNWNTNEAVVTAGTKLTDTAQKAAAQRNETRINLNRQQKRR